MKQNTEDTKIDVSRFFEPVPHMAVEARYIFTWSDGGLDGVSLSQRRDRGGDGANSQFGRIDNVPLSEVPDEVIREAQQTMIAFSQDLSELNGEGEP